MTRDRGPRRIRVVEGFAALGANAFPVSARRPLATIHNFRRTNPIAVRRDGALPKRPAIGSGMLPLKDRDKRTVLR